MQMLTVFSLILRCLYIIRIVMMRDISATESYKYLKARRLKEYDDKKTQLSEIQTLTRVTRMDCCAACSREKYCHSFHFYPDGPTCVILRERLGNISVTSTRAPGYQLYQTDKPLPRLHSGCELDVDCKTLLNSRCLQGSCRCDVGNRLHGNTCRKTKVPCGKSPGYTWDDDRNMCYRIERRQKNTWRGAERTCTMDHGHLIKPDTATKLATLRRILRTTHLSCSREKYCLSFHFYPDGPTCVTLRERFSNVSVTSTRVPGYQLFQTDKPLATVGSDCELDVDCKSLSNSHCHSGSCTCDVGHRSDGNTCRNYTVACVSTPGYTWDVDTDMCYGIEMRDKKNWTDAERSCTINQGHLVTPDTVTKNNKLRTLIQATGSRPFWIGVRKNPDAEEWQWLDKTAVTSPPWAPGQPSGDGSCVHLFKQYEWNDASCSSVHSYICEIPLN